MNHSAETLRRYLRNFDPINESMFRPPNQFSEDQCQQVKTQQPESQQEPANIAKATHATERSGIQEELDEKLKELLKREQILQRENMDQQNKIHMLAEHVSALQFENEQISSALRKNNKAYKSLKSSRGDISKSRENSNVKIHRGGCQRCQHLTDEFGKVVEIMNGFIKQFAQLFLSEDGAKIMCENFRKLLLRHSTIKFGEGRSSREFNGISQVSEWVLVLFEQIDFQNQLCGGYREKVESLVAENDTLATNVNNLEGQRQQIQHHLEALIEAQQDIAEPDEEDEDGLEKLLEIVRVAVQDIDLRHKIVEYISQNSKRQQSKKSLQKMVHNLHNFKLSYNPGDRQFVKEVKFKENLIQKTREELERARDVLTRLHRSIISCVAVREKENTLKAVLQNRQHKITQSQTVKTNTNLTDRSTNRLYEQIVKHDLASDGKQSQLSRQSSLHHIRRKIQDADSASRMLSNKLSVRFL